MTEGEAMTEIRIVIEGEDAIAATEALLKIPGISGNYTVPEAVPEAAKRETLLSTVAAIVGIVGGGIAIAEQFRKWYEEYKKGHPSNKIEKVVIIAPNGERLLLTTETIDNETTIKIAKIFDNFKQE